MNVGKATYVTQHAGASRVLITPLHSESPPRKNVISKVLLKATKKSGKSESKTFTLRNVDVDTVSTCDKLKELIKLQLCDDVTKHFDVGYYQGSTVVSIRSQQDLKEVWVECIKGTKIVLWCDGLRVCEKSGSRKRKRVESDDSESDGCQPTCESKKKASVNQEKLDEAMATLQKNYGNQYNQMQYRIWSEMYVGGWHKSLSVAPDSSMFRRAGSGTQKGARHDDDVPSSGTSAISSGTSPARAIDIRSKSYKQLVELKNLKSSGILSEEEYVSEKEAIMASLKKL